MKYCTQCGAQLQDQAVACYNCGYADPECRPITKRNTGLVVTVIFLAVAAAAAVTFMLIRVDRKSVV